MLFFYALAGSLAALTAVVEILSRYRDEPFKAMFSGWGLAYCLTNGALGAIAFSILDNSGGGIQSQPFAELAGLSASAGLGAAAILRARVLTPKVSGKSISIGPGFVVDQVLTTLDRYIDRERALKRTRIVKEYMEGIDFEKARFHVSTMILGSLQNLTSEDREELAEKIKALEGNLPPENQDKAFGLGFVILDFMGEDFLPHLFPKDKSQRFAYTGAEVETFVDDQPLKKGELVRRTFGNLDFEKLRASIETALKDPKWGLSAEKQAQLASFADSISASQGDDSLKSLQMGFQLFDLLGAESFQNLIQENPDLFPASDPDSK